MSNVIPTSVLSHWNNRVEGLNNSSQDFYHAVEENLTQEHLQKVSMERVNLHEGGILSAKREYLQVRRGEHVFHICAAPFGSGFFVSWWLGHVERGFWALIAKIPLIGGWLIDLFKPATYYNVDTALMFQSVTHGAVLSAIDHLTDVQGLRRVPDDERKPIIRDFFGQLGAK